METNDLNHGKLLEDWVHHLRLKPKTVMVRMGYESHDMLYYWYKRKEIKISVLQKWADAFKVSLQQLLAGPVGYKSQESEINESLVTYQLHQGKRLENLIEERGAKITAVAEAIDYSRQQVYNFFDQEILDDDLLNKLAKFFNVPLTYFTGGGATKGFFKENENEIIGRLQLMLNAHKAETLAAIELMMKKYCV